MKRLFFLVGWAFLIVTLATTVAFCGGGGGESEPQPNPDGVLLEGDPAAQAFAALVDLPPSPVDDKDILESRLLTTRLVAALNPDATIGQVNEALENAGSRIVSMLPAHTYLTLKIPAVASEGEARALAEQLKATGAFASAFPDYDFLPETDAPTTDDAEVKQKILPPAPNQPLEHLRASRMYAAWNAKSLAPASNLPVTVVVPDTYFADDPHGEIDAQVFVEGGGTPTDDLVGVSHPGNHGYHVCGIIGANYDETTPTGTSPDPTRLLDIRSMHNSNLGFRDKFQAFFRRFPWGDPFVVNTSIGFHRDWIGNHRMEALELALAWREMIAPYSDLFLHVTTAGNDRTAGGDAGNAQYAYFATIAHFFGDLRTQIPAMGVSPADAAAFRAKWDDVTTRVPEAAEALDNVLVVGSSFANGAERPTSELNSEVRAVGERVLAPCWEAEPAVLVNPDFCDGDVARLSGSSQAASQVAGLAAYLWALDPSLSVKRARDMIVHAYRHSPTPGIVDAYLAVLSIDRPVDLKVRKAILDVAGDTPVPGSNGRFDDNDIELFVNSFASWDGVTEAFDRYDLNGDGFTAPHGRTETFDLTADDPPAWTTVTRSVEATNVDFDETQLTDCEILRYYAYSGLYEGDHDRRRSLLLGCQEINWPEYQNMFVRIDLDPTLVDQDGMVVPTEFWTISSGAEDAGLDSDGNFNFRIDKDYVFDFITYAHRGFITGKLGSGGGVIESLELTVTITHMPSIGSQSTEDVYAQLTNIPLTHTSEDAFTFEVKGSAACSHVVDLDYAFSHPNGGHQLTDRVCTDSSWVNVVLSR